MIKHLTAGAIAATTAIASTLIALPAKAQLSTQGNTNMQVVLPGVLILYYRNTVTLNVSATDLVNGASAGASVSNGDVTINGLSGSAGMDTVAASAGLDNAANSVQANITEFWGVRGIGQGVGNPTTVTVDVTDSTICHTVNTTQCINMSLASGGTTSFIAQGLGTVRTGNVGLTLDISGAQTQGTYTGGVVRIRAEQP